MPILAHWPFTSLTEVFGDELGSIGGHFSPVNTIAIKPDGSGFATGGEDGMTD
eukprot:gene3085-3630_t